MNPAHLARARRPRPLTAKGQTTRAAILEAARQVLAEQGYVSASVARIGRRAGLSQGAFYQYFKNKEQLLGELNDLILTRFWDQALDQGRTGTGLAGAVGLGLAHLRENFFFHRILGEFELIDPVTIGYYDSLARFFRDFFRRAQAAGTVRRLDPNLLAYALLGQAYFHALDWGPDEAAYSPEELVALTIDLLRRGIAGPAPYHRPAELGVSALPPGQAGDLRPEETRTQGEKTRWALFQAAEDVFGRWGYHRASVAEITRQAGVAQGTFYVHFASKRELMTGVVEYLSRELRRELRLTTDRIADRRDQEREGMLAFFRFLRRHRHIYRVIAESETIGREAAMGYYQRLAQGYAETLAAGIKRGEIRPLPLPFLVRALMGLNHMIGLKWLVWTSTPQAEVPAYLQAEAVELVLFGLQPEADQHAP